MLERPLHPERLDPLATELSVPRLWLPSIGMTRRGMGWLPCCCGCDCDCEHSLDGTVKCCMNVTIAGMAGSGGACSEANCLAYNKIHSLFRSTSDDSGNCVWKCHNMPNFCDASVITATLYKDGSDYKLKVELGGHVWEENFGTTKPDLCKSNPGSLTHQISSGNCDSSSATCVVAMADGSGTCNCTNCAACITGTTPYQFLVVLDGIVEGSCGSCAALNDSYVVTQREPTGSLTCGYNYIMSKVCDINWIGLSIIDNGATTTIRVRPQCQGCFGTRITYDRIYADSPLNCSEIDGDDIPWISDIPGYFCDGSGSTCTVTAL